MMSPEDVGRQNEQEAKKESTATTPTITTTKSTSDSVILDLAMNNQTIFYNNSNSNSNSNSNNNSNNSYPLNKITSNAAATKEKWLNSTNPNNDEESNVTSNGYGLENGKLGSANSDADENRNATRQNDNHLNNTYCHSNGGSMHIALLKTPNGTVASDKLYHNNNNSINTNNNNKQNSTLTNGKAKMLGDSADESALYPAVGYTDSHHNQLERRDSATNVLSPLLEKENNQNTNHHHNHHQHYVDDDDDETKINTLPNINSVIIYDDQQKHGSNGLNTGVWSNSDTVEKNNLKNNLHRIQNHNNHHNYNHNNHNNHHTNAHHNHHHHHRQHNNNGSLTNGKNALGVDKLLNENDPILYKSSKSISYTDDDDECNATDACSCRNNNKLNGKSYHNAKTDDDDSKKSDEASDTPSSSSCGLFGCNPKWAANLASTHMFMVVFLLAWVCIGMFSTYFVSIITTIEKLFQIKSRTTGMLLSASELGQISTALLLTYYAGRGHRPRWIACGMVLFALAAFACALPHFIFGSQLMHSNNLFNGDKTNNQKAADLNLCLNHNAYSTHDGSSPNSSMFSNLTAATADDCMEHLKEEQDSHSKITLIVMIIFFFSLLCAGIGQVAVSTLGIPYIDDNVASKESPIYMAITIGVRILGPAAGFIVGSFCTRVFVDLSTPEFGTNDPRWISAWWLGPVMIGTVMMLASIAMFSFPKDLQGKRIKSNASESSNGDIDKSQLEEEEAKPKLRDFPKTVRRQLGNSILMFRSASSVFHILPIAGLYTFLPKYLETQFRLPAADANLITAFGGILVMGIGIIISGILILKINPSARSVAAWIAFTALMYSAGIAILMFVGCNIDDFAGLSQYSANHETSTLTFLPSCDVSCNCDFNKFSPICGIDGKTYFSSCHAGCSIADLNSSNKTYYTDCKCIPNGFDKYNVNGVDFEAVGGYCDTNCKNFILFICIFAFCVFIHSTSEVGGMLVIMRCTDPKDKAMAMGVIQSAIGLFGTVPCPIIYGAVVDSACLVWTTVCGKPGACSLYDVDNFRHYFLGITSGIMFLAFIMDVVVWSKAHRIDIAPSDTTDASSIETDFEKSINKPNTTV